MNTKAAFKLCYRYMRSDRNIAVGNTLYLTNRKLYRAASQCYIEEVSDFSGWINRARKYRFYSLKSAWLTKEW